MTHLVQYNEDKVKAGQQRVLHSNVVHGSLVLVILEGWGNMGGAEDHFLLRSGANIIVRTVAKHVPCVFSFHGVLWISIIMFQVRKFAGAGSSLIDQTFLGMVVMKDIS